MLKRLALMIPAIRNLHEERNRYAQAVQNIENERNVLIQEICDRDIKLTHSVTSIRELNVRLEELDRYKSHIDLLRGTKFPVFVGTGSPLFNIGGSSKLPPVLVISIPKAGTYLTSAYLKHLGYVDTGVHLDEEGFTDYRHRTIEEMVSRYKEFREVIPLSNSINLVGAGQFAVGHIGHSSENISLTRGCRRIFLIRDLRTALISMMRWLGKPGRGVADALWRNEVDSRRRIVAFLEQEGPNLIGWYRSISGWRFAEAMMIRFEDLTSTSLQTRREVASNIATFTGLTISIEESARLLDQVLEKPTKTWSGEYSVVENYWSEMAEHVFHSIGGAELNQELGYL